jgi:hypothetical protein
MSNPKITQEQIAKGTGVERSYVAQASTVLQSPLAKPRGVRGLSLLPSTALFRLRVRKRHRLLARQRENMKQSNFSAVNF